MLRSLLSSFTQNLCAFFHLLERSTQKRNIKICFPFFFLRFCHRFSRQAIIYRLCLRIHLDVLCWSCILNHIINIEILKYETDHWFFGDDLLPHRPKPTPNKRTSSTTSKCIYHLLLPTFTNNNVIYWVLCVWKNGAPTDWPNWW